MKKIALVIGNGSYSADEIDNLPNAISDANKIAQDLISRGFQTKVYGDLTGEKMTNVVDAIGNYVSEPGIFFVFYFAGHGCEQHGINYLYPTELPSVSASAIPRYGFPLAEILKSDVGANSARVIILDCCRKSESSWTVDERARFEELANQAGHRQSFNFHNTLIAYSTSAGDEAYDGKGKNGPYCSVLSQILLKHRIRVEDVFKEVGMAVATNSAGRQRPWFYSNLSIELTFSDLPEVVSQRAIRTPLSGEALGLVKDPHGQRAVAFGSNSRKAWCVDGIALDGEYEFGEKIELLTTYDKGFVIYDNQEQLLVEENEGNYRGAKLGLGSATCLASSKAGNRNVLGKISSYVLIEWRNGQMRTRQFDTPEQSWYGAMFLDDKNIWLLGSRGLIRRIDFESGVARDLIMQPGSELYSICRIDDTAVAICGSHGQVMKVRVATDEIIWSAHLGNTKRTPAGRTESILDITADNEIIRRFLFEPETLTLEQGELLRDALASNNLMFVASSLDHPIVIVGSDEGLLYFLDERDGQLIETIDSSSGSGFGLQGICFPDRAQLAAMNASGMVHIYSLTPVPYRQALNYVDEDPWFQARIESYSKDAS